MKINPEALTEIRQLAGYSQAQLAAAADLSPAYVSRLEAGVRSGSPAVIKRLADTLNVRVGAITAKDAYVATRRPEYVPIVDVSA